jgi:hypothetical protein
VASVNEEKTPKQCHKAITWAQRLKRVFNIDVSACPKCGAHAKVIASIEDQAVIDKILNHLQVKGACRRHSNCCLRRGPRQIQTGSHSSGYSDFSTRHSNRRTGCVAACYQN